MSEKIKCEYCNKNIIKRNLLRHRNSKECRTKQQNLNINLELIEYKCNYCEMLFNRIDKQNEHELTCTSKDIYYKLTNIIEQKDKELTLKDELIKQKNDENTFLKSQLQTYRPGIDLSTTNNTTNNININNTTINIDFSEIKQHLDKFDINVLSDHSSLINFLMNIFSNKVKLTNECKQIMSYYLNDKLINDKKCKIFLCNSASHLSDLSDKLCQDSKNNKLLNDTIVKSACLNSILINDISTGEGIKKGIRKNKPTVLVHEIVKYLKEKGITDIKGV